MKLYNVKLLVVICETLARKNIIEILNKHKITGYTTFEAQGSGVSGPRDFGLKNEKNIKIEVIMREEKLSDVVEEISRTMFADFSLVLYVSDVGILRPEKF